MNIFCKILFSVLAAACFQASAFITVIDVEEINGTVTTIVKASDYSLERMSTKYLSYRGQAEAAAQLFIEIAEEVAPGLVEVDYEIHPESQTISLTVKTQGFAGFDYSYWIIRNSGE